MFQNAKHCLKDYKENNNKLEYKINVPNDWHDFAQLCQIKSGAKVIPFLAYDYQKQLSKLIDKYPSIFVFKTRQLGITETISCKLLHKACQNKAYSSAILSIGQSESSNIAKRVRSMVTTLPSVTFVSDSLTNLEINNGGRLIFRPSTESSIRSFESISDLFFDEAAFVSKIQQIYSSAVPSQSMVGDEARTIVVSTPNGRASWFWQMFDADNGDINANEIRLKIIDGKLPPFYYWIDQAGNCKVFIHYKAHPIYGKDTEFLANTKKKYNLIDSALQREYNFGLDETISSVFAYKLIKLAAIGQWQEPIYRHNYIVGVDPATGGQDYFCAQVWDVTNTPYQLVAQYRDRKSVTFGIEQVTKLCDKYRPKLCAVENNAAGAAIVESLINKMPWQEVVPVTTTFTSKRINTDRLILLHESQNIQYPKESMLPDECQHFVQNEKGKREASAGWHDDTVMAAAISFAVLEMATQESSFKEGRIQWI